MLTSDLIPAPVRIRQQILSAADRPLEHGVTFPPGAYTDHEHYKFEIENILQREWLSVGHVSQIPHRGDYFNLELLGEPMVVVRGKDDVVRVLSRVCAHRGADVNPTEYGRPAKGNARFLICPYHFWSYDLDGRCKGAPEMHKADGFSRKDIGLPEFRTEVWNGFIFVTFASEIAPVGELYGKLGEKLAEYQLDKLEVVAEMEWDCPFNWKVMVENFAEGYHHLGAHSKTLEPMFPARSCWSEAENPSYTAAHLPLAPKWADAVREGRSEVRSFVDIPTVSPEHQLEWSAFVGFPSFLLLTVADRIIWHRVLPDGPDRVKLVTALLVSAESRKLPDFEQKLAGELDRLKRIQTEDIEVCVAVQKGMNSSRFQGGRLSHLERPIWHFQRYIARKIREALTSTRRTEVGARSYEPACEATA